MMEGVVGVVGSPDTGMWLIGINCKKLDITGNDIWFVQHLNWHFSVIS